MGIKNYLLRSILIPILLVAGFASVQLDASHASPPLLYREDWQAIPAATPVTQAHVRQENLVLNLYGSARESLKKSHHEFLPNDPYYVWSGNCEGNWAATFSHRQFLVDLSGTAKIRWRTKQSGFRKLHLVLKLADGSWLVSEFGEEASSDWKVSEFNPRELEWYTLNMERITEGGTAPSPDLSRVEEIGFTDLMRGGLSAACSRLDWLEVYGKPVARFPS